MFVTSWCPYCKQALNWMKEIQNENPEYKNIDVEIIDEERSPEIAKKYDYYYVPTYFVGENKIHEGVPSKEIIRQVFEKSLESSSDSQKVKISE
ncbi:MAG: thioredoxin family protein [Clostridium sp.]|jgi:glutaredoxin|uniref:glutaredoxin family protein n=1 Tax=Clostridium sp. TaxID=1506 RepID=UPI0025BC1004|nr:thioredoxin family protein [Clostridium sp.]MCH3965258.1 thioredoxin family protein [Clostridium sp.]MCI1714478.1 thioredoxin family protein [Clostridium sp.]MCI1798740.1 thioredoxin family protein [Clostridium sp.]MCI1812529.1 thioredoxin family protein [Clostridium sp.]MCI1869550.1 thioredoxin family protein [Clostridium sp.]